MSYRTKGLKQIHFNVQVTDTEFKVFRSMGEPKEVIFSIIHANMNALQKLQSEIELKQEIIRKAQQDIVVLEKMRQVAQQNEVVLQASPEIEEKRSKLTARLIEKPFGGWTQQNRVGMIESKLWTNVAELKAWVKRKQNGGAEAEPDDRVPILLEQSL